MHRINICDIVNFCEKLRMGEAEGLLLLFW